MHCIGVRGSKRVPVSSLSVWPARCTVFCVCRCSRSCLVASSALLGMRESRRTPPPQDTWVGKHTELFCVLFLWLRRRLQVGMLTHQPPELLQDGRMSPAVDIYRCASSCAGQLLTLAGCVHPATATLQRQHSDVCLLDHVEVDQSTTNSACSGLAAGWHGAAFSKVPRQLRTNCTLLAWTALPVQLWHPDV